jgi:hypothetical protein
MMPTPQPNIPHRSTDWSAECWSPIAATVGPRHERDLAYRHRWTGERLLIRFSDSVTSRRIAEANAILAQDDFDWIVLVPAKGRPRPHCADHRLAIIEAEIFSQLAGDVGLI